MKRLLSTIIVLFVCIISATLAKAGEKDVLKALEKIKGAVETGVSYQRYGELVADAKVEINIYKRAKKENEKFLKAVEKSHQNYQSALQSWTNSMEFSDDIDYELKAKNLLRRTMQDRWKAGAKYLDEAYGYLN